MKVGRESTSECMRITGQMGLLPVVIEHRLYATACHVPDVAAYSILTNDLSQQHPCTRCERRPSLFVPHPFNVYKRLPAGKGVTNFTANCILPQGDKGDAKIEF